MIFGDNDELNQEFATRVMMFNRGFGPDGEVYFQAGKVENKYEYVEPKKKEWDSTPINASVEINIDKKFYNKNNL